MMNRYLIYILIVLVIVSVVFFSAIFIEQFDVIFHADNRNEWGAIGNFFGGTVGTIASLCGFILLVITLLVNQEEFKEQAAVIKKQRFEDSFFALLEQHNRILERILSDFDKAANGRNKLNPANRVIEIFKNYEPILDEKGNSIRSLPIAKEFLLQFDPSLNQYFRILYQLLKFIAIECPSTSLEKFDLTSLRKTECSVNEKFYSNIARACLPADFYYLLAINCFAENENDQYFLYKTLIERYAFLEHMSNAQSLNQNKLLLNEISEYYSNKAFGSNKAFSTNN